MQYIPGIILGILTLVIITKPFTVLFHELGHAIPAMIMTKEGATIYVGSYGDQKQSFKIHIAGLEIWFRYNNENSYVYINLGIYHLIKNENEEALKYFLQSKQMDKDTDLVEEYINKATSLV